MPFGESVKVSLNKHLVSTLRGCGGEKVALNEYLVARLNGECLTPLSPLLNTRQVLGSEGELKLYKRTEKGTGRAHDAPAQHKSSRER